MGSMSWGDWFAFGSVVVTVGIGFAIPFGIWMAKMYTGQKLISQTLRNVRRRVNRLEKAKDSQQLAISTAIQHATRLFQDQTGSNTDRINEHAEQISNHNARLTTAETEVNRLRDLGHQFKNYIQRQQEE